MKLTREQLQSRKDKAVRFTENVLGDPERAAEIADESLDDYAARRRIVLTNSGVKKGRNIMEVVTKRDLEDQIDELEAENEALREQLDAIAEIVAPEEDGDKDEDDDDDDSE